MKKEIDCKQKYRIFERQEHHDWERMNIKGDSFLEIFSRTPIENFNNLDWGEIIHLQKR